MPDTALPTVLIVSDHGNVPPPYHRLLREAPNHSRIDLNLRAASQRNLWAARLDHAMCHAEGPVLLVAHGVACLAVAWWARLSPAFYLLPVKGALLIAPVEASRDGHDQQDPFASPKSLLPFPSIVVRDEEAPIEGDDHIRALALSWGSHLAEGTDLGAFGAREGQAAWLQGERMLKELVATAIPGDALASAGALATIRRPSASRRF